MSAAYQNRADALGQSRVRRHCNAHPGAAAAAGAKELLKQVEGIVEAAHVGAAHAAHAALQPRLAVPDAPPTQRQ